LRGVWHLAAAISFLGGTAFADEAGQSCKTSHNLVGTCFSVRGRLFVADNSGGIRIAADGIDRLYAVLDRQSAQGEQAVPAAIQLMLAKAPAAIAGDYLLCPFDKMPVGRVQAVCIQEAMHLFLVPQPVNPSPSN
jgi:hypothetical protein